MKERFFEFQKKGVEFGLSRFGRVLIGDEMGLGKTVQALGLAHIYKKDWPLLIICPSALKYNWRNEVRDWMPDVEALLDV